jgi:hypothetical protein
LIQINVQRKIGEIQIRPLAVETGRHPALVLAPFHHHWPLLIFALVPFGEIE